MGHSVSQKPTRSRVSSLWKAAARRQAADERGGVPARQRARGRDAAYLNRYFGAGAPGGGTIVITNEVGFSVGPNGPGTLFFTAGMLLR